MKNRLEELFNKNERIMITGNDYVYMNTILSIVTNEKNKEKIINELHNFFDFINNIVEDVFLIFNISICGPNLTITITKSSESLDPRFNINFDLKYKLRDHISTIYLDIFETFYYSILNEEQQRKLLDTIK